MHKFDKVDVFNDALGLLHSDLKQAIYAVHNKVQSPLSLITTSVLSTLSSAIQGYVDVETIYGAQQPVSLYTLVIAESGERKTSTDKLIALPLLRHDKKILEVNNELIADIKVERLIWLERIKKTESILRKAIASENLELEQSISNVLSALHREEPSAISTTQSLLSDVTPAALFQALSGDRKAIALHSSDAGNLFTKMNMDFISNVNLLWDGEDISIVRKSGNITINSGRLTLALMLQPAILKCISDRKEDSLRLSGYFSRMLVTAPQSTQGSRFGGGTSEQDEIYLKLFHDRIDVILQESIRHQSWNSRITLKFESHAQYLLNQFYREIELQLRDSAAFSDIRDAGSKILNNATRIAALLHIYEFGVSTIEINANTVDAACSLARFYLLEFSSIFGEKTVQQLGKEYGDILLDWIYKNQYNYFNKNISRVHLLRYGPNRLRKKEKLELAINYLVYERYIDYYYAYKPAYIQWIRDAPINLHSFPHIR